jgi:hypothetical protein
LKSALISLAIAALLHSPPAFLDMSASRRKTENTPDFLNKKNRADASPQRARFYWRIKKIAFPTLQ